VTDDEARDREQEEGTRASDELDVPATIFVSDPSAEAERVAQQLRASGFGVVDVPLSMLAARVAVQTPSVAIIDADATGVLDALLAVRGDRDDLPLEVLFLGQPGAEVPLVVALGLASECFFTRPVDPLLVAQRIEALAHGTNVTRKRESHPSAPRSSPPRSLPPAPTAQPWPQAIPDRRSPVPASGGAPSSVRGLDLRGPSSSSIQDAPLSARSGRAAVSIRTSLSSELEALLAEAELKVGSQMMGDLVPPTPEEELEAVLPEALLAALDEPIDDDDDDALADPPRSRLTADLEPRREEGPGAETNAGRALTPAPRAVTSEALGVAPTMAAPPMIGEETSHALPEGAPAFTVPRERPASVEGAAPGGPASLLGPEDAARLLASSIASRTSGCLTVEADGGLRRVVLREGDVVTAASSAEEETLLVFLTTRGDLRRDQVKDLLGRVPPFGRHAGAALVGHGILRQDQLWPILRAHAEWVLGKLLLVGRGTARVDAEAPGRLKQEPSVFGGSSGAEVLVEVVRRVVAPEEAMRRLGGPGATVTDGPSALLAECALDGKERALVESLRGVPLAEAVGSRTGGDLASALYALALLGVIQVAAPGPVDFATRAGQPSEARDGSVDALDLAAIRERVRARSDLVSEADYFTLLGVPRDATGYEVRRAYVELRRSFEPSRVLLPELADLEADVRTIVSVLDEAYEILRDGARRERYRKALGD